jgi:hypothetical protein
VGCRNRLLAVIDAASGRLITTEPIGEHVDGAVFNSITREIFTSCGEGTLTVIHEDSPDAYHVAGFVKTQRGARTVALDENSRRLFLATARFVLPPMPAAGQPTPRPVMMPGSFMILVVAP